MDGTNEIRDVIVAFLREALENRADLLPAVRPSLRRLLACWICKVI